ncbi:MAG: hypothetical protein ACRELB_19425 [Polyangiaceae bacterium]
MRRTLDGVLAPARRKKWLRGGLVALAALVGVGGLAGLAGLAGVAGAWRGCESHERAEQLEEQEERDMLRDNFWRARIAISGRGRVETFIDAFDCASEGAGQHGECGPKLVRFKELAPPTMQARPAPGWRFDHWEASIREPDGGAHARPGKMPDGRVYIDGFGHTDTGQLETVTAVFLPDGDAHDGVQP